MFDHPLIIILILVAGFLRWLYERSQASKDEPQRPSEADQPIPRAAAEPGGEEERIRRFLEALGQPTTSPPPPKVAPKREAPRTILPQPTFHRLPPLTTVPPPLPQPIPEIPRVRPAQIEQRVFQPTIAKESVFEVQDFGVQAPEGLASESRSAATPRTLIPDLTSPRSLRSAIVLREIFGPPRGLQTMETIV